MSSQRYLRVALRKATMRRAVLWARRYMAWTLGAPSARSVTERVRAMRERYK